MVNPTKSALVLVLIAALTGCSDDTPQENAHQASTSQPSMPDDSSRAQEIQGQSSILGTVAGAAVGATVGTMLGNSLSNQEKDKERNTSRTSGVIPYSGGTTSGSDRVKSSTVPAMPKANIISRGSTFSGMNSGS